MRFVEGEREVDGATAQKELATSALVFVPREIFEPHAPESVPAS
jgi:hypothetical protein